LEELKIVLSAGLAGCSRISVVRAKEGERKFKGIGICSIVSLEVLAELDTEIGGGFRFLLVTDSEEPDDSAEGLLLLS
jgi:hypothetical protein